MIKTRKWHVLLYGAIALYVLAIIGIIILLSNLNDYHNNKQREYEQSIKNEINKIIKNDNNMKQQLESLYEKERIELIVIDDNDKTIYNSIAYENFDELKSVINNNVVGNKIMYKVSNDTNDYFVWVTTYFQDVQSFYSSLILYVCITIILLVTTILIVIIILYQKMINPLKTLEQNIKDLKNYEFKEITSTEQLVEYNALSKSLVEFAQNIDRSIKQVESKYIEMESKLVIKEDDKLSKKELIRSLIHELKTPISLAILNVEVAKRNNDKAKLDESILILEELPNQINEIMRILSVDTIDDTIQEIDLVKMISDSLNYHQPLFDENNLYCDFIAPDKLNLSANLIVIKQIIYNALSNCIKYSKNEVEIIALDEGDYINITFKNDSDLISEEIVKTAFDLFTRFDDANKEGSGSGLFIIRQLVTHLNGNVTFDYQDGWAILIINLPKK